MVNVVYSQDIPAEARAAFEPVLTRHLHRLPTWVHEIWIYWTTDKGSLCTSVDYEYRQGRIGIAPGFLEGDARQRERHIIHELLHFSLDPLEKLGREMIDQWLTDATVAQKLYREQYRIALESSVTDLARMVQEAIEEQPHTGDLIPSALLRRGALDKGIVIPSNGAV